jgi:hypothetical protein
MSDAAGSDAGARPVGRVRVSASGIGARRVGDANGVLQRAWRELRIRGGDIVAEVDEAHAAGHLPHLAHALDPEFARRAEALRAAWSKHERLVLLGDAGAVAAMTALGCPETLATVVDPLEARPDLVVGAGLIVLEGPPWVKAVAGAMAAAAAACWRVQGDGTGGSDSTAPSADSDGATVVSIVGGADPRFAALTPAAAALASLAGADLDAISAALSRAAKTALLSARVENPALELGQAAVGLVEGPGRGAPALVVPRNLSRWARHAARVWVAFTGRERHVSGLRHPPAGTPQVLERGDEVAAVRLSGGPADAWALVVSAPTDGAVSVEASLASADLDAAWSTLLLEAGCPVVTLSLPDASAAGRAAGMLIITHAALFVAVHRGIEPLALPAADRLREVQRDRRVDSH